jgi:class 3 adenylate cyclase
MPWRIVVRMPPETKYASVGDSMIAYQVLGDGPIDLVILGSLASNVDVQWDVPAIARQRERLASFSRLIMFDRRGTGASDPIAVEELAAFEHWNDDLLAVLDATESDRVSLLCEVDGGLWGLLFAATHPSRTNSIVIWNGYARSTTADDYPFGQSPEATAGLHDLLFRLWGTEELLRLAAPEGDSVTWQLGAKLQRSSMTPAGLMRRLNITDHMDVRHVLPTIQAPTLVLHAKENAFAPVELGRYLADHIANARFVEVPGGDVQLVRGPALDIIEEFLTGTAPSPVTDRVLATLLFTDIVGSTEHVATLGDRRWRQKLDAHDSAAKSNVERFAGRLIKTTGDGMLATFDGPGKAIRCAHALQSALKDIDVRIRAGLHTGEVELRADDIGGLAVHIGARVMGAATEGEVWCTRTVRDLVAGSGITFEDRGSHRLKGVPDEWHLFAVSGP